jgi:lipid-A-disaccharide synthase-like uncharacterized protein
LRADYLWLIIGFVGQAVFGTRFLVQWIYSEKYGRSLIPIAFWYLSLAGGVILFSYAVHRRDRCLSWASVPGFLSTPEISILFIANEGKRPMLSKEHGA